tara:strand:+ start:215 stop:784 length:570 start_codon:yes stop_codon:yes gene_type:complete
MPTKTKKHDSPEDKACMAELAESLRRDGNPDYIARTATIMEVDRKSVSTAMREYRDGKLTLTATQVDQFYEGEYEENKQRKAYLSQFAGMAVLKNIGELLQLKEVKTLEDHRMTAKIVEIYSKAFVNLTRVTGALRGDNTSMSPSQATQQTQTNIQITLPPKQDLPIEEGHITVSEIYSDDSKESEENA